MNPKTVPTFTRSTFTTNHKGKGKYECADPIGDGNSVFINDWNGFPSANQGTVLVSVNVNDD